MTRDEYLQILRDNLTTMTDDEKDDVIRYYLEYFSDSGDEQAAMEELGAPEKLAGRLCGTNSYQGDAAAMPHTDNVGSYSGKIYEDDTYSGNSSSGTYTYTDDSHSTRNKKKMSAGKAVALACTAPFWIPFALAGLMVAMGVAIAGLAIVFAVFLVFAALIIAGIACVVAGILGFAKSVADGIMVIGGGIFCVGAGILIFLFGRQMVKWISFGVKKLFKRQ